MIKPKYQIGDRIPGTIGTVVSKTYSYEGKWIYCISFDGGFLTIIEDQIDSSIIQILKPNK